MEGGSAPLFFAARPGLQPSPPNSRAEESRGVITSDNKERRLLAEVMRAGRRHPRSPGPRGPRGATSWTPLIKGFYTFAASVTAPPAIGPLSAAGRNGANPTRENEAAVAPSAISNCGREKK